MSKMTWELAGARCLLGLAADKNVRAPVVVATYATGLLSPDFTFQPESPSLKA
jgi:hypothetical protein